MVLKRWGFTPQRPLKRAYEQRPAEVKCWLQEEYPHIKAQAKAENAEIWWGDETAVKPEAHTRRSFAPRGKTPVVRQPARRFHSSLISAINNQGKMQWMALKEALNADLLIRFLKQLIKHRKRKIILIVDNLRVHHAKLVKGWLEEHKEHIAICPLTARNSILMSTSTMTSNKPLPATALRSLKVNSMHRSAFPCSCSFGLTESVLSFDIQKPNTLLDVPYTYNSIQ